MLITTLAKLNKIGACLMIFTDAEIKEDLWAWNGFQDRLDEGLEEEKETTKEEIK